MFYLTKPTKQKIVCIIGFCRLHSEDRNVHYCWHTSKKQVSREIRIKPVNQGDKVNGTCTPEGEEGGGLNLRNPHVSRDFPPTTFASDQLPDQSERTSGPTYASASTHMQTCSTAKEINFQESATAPTHTLHYRITGRPCRAPSAALQRRRVWCTARCVHARSHTSLQCRALAPSHATDIPS